MNVRRFLCVAGLLALLGLAGCSGAPVRLGEGARPAAGEVDYSRGRTLSASASGFQLLLFIPINVNDRQERAWQLLRGQAGGDYITDVKIQESWTWAFIGTVYKTTLEATAYPRKTP